MNGRSFRKVFKRQTRELVEDALEEMAAQPHQHHPPLGHINEQHFRVYSTEHDSEDSATSVEDTWRL